MTSHKKKPCLTNNIQLLLLLLLGLVFLLFFGTRSTDAYAFFRQNEDTTARNIQPVGNESYEHDIITLDRYLRNYLTGPIHDQYAFLNHDGIMAYAGPRPFGVPTKQPSSQYTAGTVRAWAMFDEKTRKVCQISSVQNFGEVAMFLCPHPGVYRAFAVEHDVIDGALTEPDSSLFIENTLQIWTTRRQLVAFDFLFGSEISYFKGISTTTDDRINKLIEYAYNSTTDPIQAVRSDPVMVKKSFYCYYWMYLMFEKARVGYVRDEVVPSSAGENSTSYILLELIIWVGEPSAIAYSETSDTIHTIEMSLYSKLLTNSFSSVGLFPCLRKAHSVIEVVSEMYFVHATDQNNPMKNSPHWTALIKIHTDRMISTLTDVSFTIASRQNSGLFGCFVADTRAFVNLRTFEFVQRGKLEKDSINLENSNLWETDKKNIKHQIKHVYGHGVQYIGYKWSKFFQPSTSRTDMVVVSNPCIAQEFALSAGGSLYVAEGLLNKGEQQTQVVNLPEFVHPNSRGTDPREFRHYLRVLDVAFTPTHLVFLMANGDIILHSSAVTQKGIARLTNVKKYQPAALVKRRWCPRTSTPKLSAQMVPIFGRGGSIIVLQLFGTEGTVRMWVTPPTTSCIAEGVGFVAEAKDRSRIINETDIHYNEFAAVKRSDHKTGLQEKPYEKRPEPPAAPPVNKEEKLTYVLNNNKQIGEDPHFPPELTNPASNVLNADPTNYNEALIYVLDEDKRLLTKALNDNGISNINSGTGSTKDDIALLTVQFTAVEKQFILGARFKGVEVTSEFAASPKEHPFQMLITTVTVTNFPFKIKLKTDYRGQDEKLHTLIPFPGVLILRSTPTTVGVVASRDPEEEKEHVTQLQGNTFVEYSPGIFTMNTALPSYVIDFGNVFVYTSLDGRYGRPLHFFDWNTTDSAITSAGDDQPAPLTLEQSRIIFTKDRRLYDALVTEQGIISVLWRKVKRHLVQDDPSCKPSPDSAEHQTVAMGSVVSLEGLREVKPFFRNDNVFQKATPDGEVIYGIYDVKPHSPFKSCPEGDSRGTKEDNEVCIHQATEPVGKDAVLLPPCSQDFPAPCRDPGYLQHCNESFDDKRKHSCLRLNKMETYCGHDSRYAEPGFSPPANFTPPAHLCDAEEPTVTPCLPKHAPREELRSAEILGTPFLGYLHGSLKRIKSIHPEAPPTEGDQDQEADVCPFSSFLVYNTDFDFAEVGYETRITGEISYLGVTIPIEADLIVEYERTMGIIIEINTQVYEERDLTTIRKTIDLKFEMTDYTLKNMSVIADKINYNASAIDYDDVRAREITSVFSITLRPSIINMRCKNADFFKTIQFNVGCNAYSDIRLLSEASPFKRVNWTEVEETNSDEFKWFRDTISWNLTIPAAHIHHRQLKTNAFKCVKDSKGFPSFCKIPYYENFKNEIFTVSYRDLFFPQFEQFLTVSSRRVSGNVIIYDLLGSKEFNLTVNQLKARCYTNGHFWYDTLLNTTRVINRGSSVHEDVYDHYEDCFKSNPKEPNVTREHPYQLHSSPFYLHNLTNKNKMRFRRNRNQIFIFRAAVLNTYFNRFSYCKLLETFFMVRVTGIPIPRQGLSLWHYIVVMLLVCIGFFASYVTFYKFYTWKLDLGAIPGQYLDEDDEPDKPWIIDYSEGYHVESDHIIRYAAERLPEGRKTQVKQGEQSSSADQLN